MLKYRLSFLGVLDNDRQHLSNNKWRNGRLQAAGDEV